MSLSFPLFLVFLRTVFVLIVLPPMLPLYVCVCVFSLASHTHITHTHITHTNHTHTHITHTSYTHTSHTHHTQITHTHITHTHHTHIIHTHTPHTHTSHTHTSHTHHTPRFVQVVNCVTNFAFVILGLHCLFKGRRSDALIKVVSSLLIWTGVGST